MYIRGCKKSFCNKDCKGILFNDIKNGFHKHYTKKRVKSLKKRGALSGCIYSDIKNKFEI